MSHHWFNEITFLIPTAYKSVLIASIDSLLHKCKATYEFARRLAGFFSQNMIWSVINYFHLVFIIFIKLLVQWTCAFDITCQLFLIQVPYYKLQIK